eukprot:GEMP01002087.1.p1 GENE.GEMP01002087.1~~GEMP01002087.1.p1  ORF type:complete len:1071 (+),score=236.05 GEMP01002087.1:1015-4227(+)
MPGCRCRGAKTKRRCWMWQRSGARQQAALAMARGVRHFAAGQLAAGHFAAGQFATTGQIEKNVGTVPGAVAHQSLPRHASRIDVHHTWRRRRRNGGFGRRGQWRTGADGLVARAGIAWLLGTRKVRHWHGVFSLRLGRYVGRSDPSGVSRRRSRRAPMSYHSALGPISLLPYYLETAQFAPGSKRARRPVRRHPRHGAPRAAYGNGVLTMFDGFLDLPVPKALGRDPPDEAMAFFTGNLYEANSGIGVGTDIGLGIRNWLRIFDLLKAHLTVRLVIERQRHLRGKKKRKSERITMDEVFMLSLRFGKDYVPLPKYVQTCADDHLRQSTYQFLSALNTYLPPGALDRLTLGNECCLEDGELEDFMIDCAPTLSALGVELVLPKMLEKLLKPRIVVSARNPTGFQPKSYSEFLVTHDVLEFEYRVSLGENMDCSITEWKRLVSQNKRLVEFNGRYVVLDPAHVAHLLRELENKLNGPPPAASPIELLQAAIGGKPGVILSDGLEQFLSNMLRMKDVEVPSIIQATLRPYQKNGYQWLVNHARNGLGAILADDMGLGKTVQMIAAIAHFRQETTQEKDAILPIAAPAEIPSNGPPVSQEPIAKKPRGRPRKTVKEESMPLTAPPIRPEPQPLPPPPTGNNASTINKEPPVLILVPTTLLSNWSHELEKWAPTLTYLIFHGGTRKRARAGANNLFATSDIVLTSYGTFRADAQALVSTTWSMCILDEAQNIKNHSSAISKGVKLIRVTRARFALTGTPVENQLADIHSLFEFCLPGYFPSLKVFSDKVSKPIERDHDTDEALRLQQAIGPFVLRRMKTDRSIIADLPPKVIIDDSITLSTEQCAMYQCVLNSHFKGIENNEGRARRGAIFALIALLKQICNHPACMEKKEPDHTMRLEQSGKCVYLANMLEPLIAQGDKVLIFTQYIHMLGLLHSLLVHRFHVPIVKLHGGMTLNARDAAVAQFQTDPNTQLFLISLKAGGTGLNLTAASHVVHFDRWWNPAVEDQATDRAFRIGQQKTVFVHKFTTVGSFEEKIAMMLEQKRSLGEMTVSEGESWLADMNDKELKDLFSLHLG